MTEVQRGRIDGSADAMALDAWVDWATRGKRADAAAFFRRIKSALLSPVPTPAPLPDRCAHCASPLLRPLTRRQSAILAHLAHHIARHGYAPTFEEIARHFGFASLSTVHGHLQNLERKGWIRRSRARCRAIEILATERSRAVAASEERTRE